MSTYTDQISQPFQGLVLSASSVYNNFFANKEDVQVRQKKIEQFEQGCLEVLNTDDENRNFEVIARAAVFMGEGVVLSRPPAEYATVDTYMAGHPQMD